jgi:hypothetical protein
LESQEPPELLAPKAQLAEGSRGPAGTALAFAHITGKSGGGTVLDAANSQNVSAASEPQAGLYCITTAVPIKNATGVVDFGHQTKNPQSVQANFDLIPLAVSLKLCPASTSVLVETPNNTGTDEASDFWINFN